MSTDLNDDSENSLEDLTDVGLIKKVEDLQLEITHLDAENQVLENFLQKNEPTLIVGMAQILELASKMQQNQTHSTIIMLDRRDTVTDSIRGSTSRRTDSIVRFAATSTSTGDKGPRINLSQRMDLAIREMEDMQICLEEFIKKSHRMKCNLKAKLEEISIRETEVEDARSIFEQNIVIEGVDTLTQRIPAEKFLRYMEEWLRSAESTIEKMRLRTSTLKSLYIKLSSQLIQKEELGGAIDAVDFDQLRIQNKYLHEKIEQKNTHLLELKRTNGTANLVLSTNKKYLQKQVQDIKKIKQNIKHKEQIIIELDNECKTVEKQVQKEIAKFDKTYNLTLNFTVPNTMEYIKTKVKLMELKKQLKIWERKNHIQQFGLNSCIRQMKILTGSKATQASWFKVVEKNSSDTFDTDDDMYMNESGSSRIS